jgi:hypothetical protein
VLYLAQSYVRRSTSDDGHDLPTSTPGQPHTKSNRSRLRLACTLRRRRHREPLLAGDAPLARKDHGHSFPSPPHSDRLRLTEGPASSAGDVDPAPRRIPHRMGGGTLVSSSQKIPDKQVGSAGFWRAVPTAMAPSLIRLQPTYPGREGHGFAVRKPLGALIRLGVGSARGRPRVCESFLRQTNPAIRVAEKSRDGLMGTVWREDLDEVAGCMGIEKREQ